MEELTSLQNDSQHGKDSLVSTCIISYNHERFLPNAIESVLNQTYEHQEVIIVDDGSSDNSLKIAEFYERQNPGKVRVYTHSGHANCGISATCNLALKKANGKYIGWLGSDDIALPKKLEQQVRVLDDNPTVGIVYSPAKTINEDGVEDGYSVGERFSKSEIHLYQIIKKNLIPAPTVLVRKECFRLLGGYDETLIYSDWEMWLRILAHWELGFIDEPTVLYRVHRTNTSIGISADVDVKRKQDVILTLFQKIGHVQGALAEPNAISMLNQRLASIVSDGALCHLNNFYLSCRDGELTRSLAHLFRAFKTSPSRIMLPRRLGSIIKHIGFGIYRPRSRRT